MDISKEEFQKQIDDRISELEKIVETATGTKVDLLERLLAFNKEFRTVMTGPHGVF